MKIFNVNLNKCGSLSLTEAMKILSLKSYHYSIKGKIIKDMVLSHGFNGFPRFDFLGDFGNGDPRIFIPIIEKNYFDAKFILTTRDKKSRFKSWSLQKSKTSLNYDDNELGHEEYLKFYFVNFFTINSFSYI